jgi:Na+-transporting NADH:ubiquinone oxidoreductase subunit NqrE
MDQIFKHLKIIAPPSNLERIILTRVSFIVRRRFAFRGLLALGAFSGVIWSLPLIGVAITESGFYSYLSLFISDSGLALTYWRELSLTLVESIPLFTLIIFFGLVTFFFWIIPRVVDDAQLVLSPVN